MTAKPIDALAQAFEHPERGQFWTVLVIAWVLSLLLVGVWQYADGRSDGEAAQVSCEHPAEVRRPTRGVP